jgi:hypothetical protein
MGTDDGGTLPRVPVSRAFEVRVTPYIRRLPRFVLAVCSVFLLSASPARSGENTFQLTLAPAAGYAKLDESTGIDGGIALEARVGLLYRGRVGIEGAYGKIQADSEQLPDRDFPADHWGVDVTWTILPGGTVRPFLLAGWGQVDVDTPDEEKVRLNGLEFGGGVGLNLLETAEYEVDLRVGFRNIVAENTAPLDGAGDSKSHLLVAAEVQVRIPGPWADDDGDGVTDRYDRCPYTRWGTAVDARGCDRDTDGDGVPDGQDLCPDTPPRIRVDDRGCPAR